jgi:two-component system OmpR family response regulator
LFNASITDYDALILDVMLPAGDGFSVCRQLRAHGSHVPVLMLTARDAVESRIEGLDSGADDYLIKPFAPEELAARLRAVCRRSAGVPDARVRCGPVAIDLHLRCALRDGQRVDLTAREWALLEALALRAGRIVLKGELERLVHGFDVEVTSNALEVHISSLRKKLGRDLIATVRGLGYRLDDTAT